MPAARRPLLAGELLRELADVLQEGLELGALLAAVKQRVHLLAELAPRSASRGGRGEHAERSDYEEEPEGGAAREGVAPIHVRHVVDETHDSNGIAAGKDG